MSLRAVRRQQVPGRRARQDGGVAVRRRVGAEAAGAGRGAPTDGVLRGVPPAGQGGVATPPTGVRAGPGTGPLRGEQGGGVPPKLHGERGPVHRRSRAARLGGGLPGRAGLQARQRIGGPCQGLPHPKSRASVT
ncbi:unnamed protein product [Musa acuminata subsp. burmannicoides]